MTLGPAPAPLPRSGAAERVVRSAEMRRLTAVPLLALAVVLATPARGSAGTPPADPCAAAKARIPERAAAAAAAGRAEIDAYRASWRAACDPSGPPHDLAALVSEADALVTDVRIGRAVAALVAALSAGDRWPLPGIHRSGGAVDVDWAAFAGFAARGGAEDGRYFRGFARATDADGDPAWLGPAPTPDAAPCVRLAETSWRDVAQGLEEMEGSRSPIYAKRAALLRERLVATLTALGRGGPVCGCVRGDPLPPLEALAATSTKLGTPARRELAAAAAAARDALRRGAATISWLRERPDAPPSGCGATR